MVVPFLIYACASISAPDGGPEDVTPPKLISSYPEAGSINFKEKTVTLYFSEYLDEKSLAKAITISPKIDPTVDIVYDDDAIVLEFPNTLLKDQTYVITINRSLKDERNVSLEQSVQIAFSTGDVIDNGMISGRVYGEGSYAVHLWEKTIANNDSIYFTTPQYVSEANDAGDFEFKYLGPGEYVILAVERSASGAKLVTERMAYGVSPKISYVIGENVSISGIPLRIQREIAPIKLTHGEWVGQRWGWMHFNQELDSVIINDLVIEDAEGQLIYPKIYQDMIDRKRFLIISNDTLAGGKASLSFKELRQENRVLSNGRVNFRVSSKQDTSYTEKLSPEGPESIERQLGGGPKIPIHFSKPIMDVSDSAFILVTDSDTAIVSLDWVNPLSAEFLPPKGWKEKTKYTLQIFSKGLTPIEGRALKDSIQLVTINSEKKIGYGGLKGQFMKIDITPLMQLKFIKKESEVFHSMLDSSHNFHFQNLPEGLYKLMIIDDVDQSGSYSNGRASPFKKSEWFYVHPDTFEVRANWDIDIGLIQAGKH